MGSGLRIWFRTGFTVKEKLFDGQVGSIKYSSDVGNGSSGLYITGISGYHVGIKSFNDLVLDIPNASAFLRAKGYGSGTRTGTLAYISGWDALGNFIEVDPGTIGGGGGGGITQENSEDYTGALFATDNGDIDFTYNDATPDIGAQIKAGVIVDADINASAAIGATKLIDGSITDAELGYINTLSSNAQTQLNAKLSTTITDNNLAVSGTTLSTNKAVQSLTDGATITMDAASGYNATVTIAATGRTLAISNPQAGQYYTVKIVQDATGSRTITTWPTGTKWIGGAAPTLQR